MVLEIAEIYIRDGEQAAFEEAISRALTKITAKAKGASSFSLHKSLESPDRYVLQVSWDTVEDHTVTYINSPERAVWRSIVSPFLVKSKMEHFSVVIAS
jgi:heme-degrading monooxygenase HmoA